MISDPVLLGVDAAQVPNAAISVERQHFIEGLPEQPIGWQRHLYEKRFIGSHIRENITIRSLSVSRDLASGKETAVAYKSEAKR